MIVCSQEREPLPVSGIRQLSHDGRALVRLLRIPQQFHADLRGGPVPFSVVASQTATDDVFPTRFATAAARNYMVQAELIHRISVSTVLARMIVTGKQCSAIETQNGTGNAVVAEQPDYSRNKNWMARRANPLDFRRLVVGISAPFSEIFFGGKFAHHHPRSEIVCAVLAMVNADNFSQFPIKQNHATANRHHMNRCEKTVQYQNAAIQRAVFGGLG